MEKKYYTYETKIKDIYEKPCSYEYAKEKANKQRYLVNMIDRLRKWLKTITIMKKKLNL